MMKTAEYNNEWYEVEAGLINVRAAAMYPVLKLTNSRNPKKFNDSTAVQQEKRIVSSILSPDNETNSAETSEKLTTLMIHSPSHKIRAAALCKLTTFPNITCIELKEMLSDPSSYVKMAALFYLHNRKDLWTDSISHVIPLFKDEDYNIQYCAIKLASAIGDSSLIKPLISGLLNDAVQLRVSIFGARCEALRAFNRHHI